jgi:hypothetical protein
MPKTKRYRQARALQKTTGARYTEALASQAPPAPASPPASEPKEADMTKTDTEFTMRIPGTTQQVTGDEQSVRRVVHDIAAQRIARTAWPADPEAAMSALAGLFPSMHRSRGTWVPGTNPWDALALVEWLNTSGEPTSGSRQAALFLLSVWNSDDWQVHGLRIRQPEPGDWEGSRRIGRFDFRDAWGVWDQQHREAALAWLTNPFWP